MFLQKIIWKKCTDAPNYIKMKHIENCFWVDLPGRVCYIILYCEDTFYTMKIILPSFNICRIGSSWLLLLFYLMTIHNLYQIILSSQNSKESKAQLTLQTLSIEAI